MLILFFQKCFLNYKKKRNNSPPSRENCCNTKALTSKKCYNVKRFSWSFKLLVIIHPFCQLLLSYCTICWRRMLERKSEKGFPRLHKNMYSYAPILIHFDPSKLILMQVDDSSYKVEALIVHKMDNGSWFVKFHAHSQLQTEITTTLKKKD